MTEDHESTIDRLLSELRQKYIQLSAIRLEVNKANRDYERLSIPGAIANMRRALEESESECRKLRKELERLMCL